jgi:hypothetical protein
MTDGNEVKEVKEVKTIDEKIEELKNLITNQNVSRETKIEKQTEGIPVPPVIKEVPKVKSEGFFSKLLKFL